MRFLPAQAPVLGELFPCDGLGAGVCERKREHSLILSCRSGIIRIDPEKLEFCEVIRWTLLFQLASGKVLKSTWMSCAAGWSPTAVSCVPIAPI